MRGLLISKRDKTCASTFDNAFKIYDFTDLCYMRINNFFHGTVVVKG